MVKDLWSIWNWIWLLINFKGVLLCSFTKSWFCFGGVLEHALILGGSKNALFFTQFTLLQYLSPQPGTNGSISSGFDEGPPSEKRNVLWLVSCPIALWLANSLDDVSVLPRPLPKQQAISIHIDILYLCQFRPREYWTRGSRRTFARTDIARHIRVVTLLLFFGGGLNHVLDTMSKTA